MIKICWASIASDRSPDMRFTNFFDLSVSIRQASAPIYGLTTINDKLYGLNKISKELQQQHIILFSNCFMILLDAHGPRKVHCPSSSQHHGPLPVRGPKHLIHLVKGKASTITKVPFICAQIETQKFRARFLNKRIQIVNVNNSIQHVQSSKTTTLYQIPPFLSFPALFFQNSKNNI